MSLRKNSTDKKKYVFHTQLEKGNFSVFEEYDFDEVMGAFRTSQYYTFDAILKYFNTLEDKKNGQEILTEKLQYLKDKGFSFLKTFNKESFYSTNYEPTEINVFPMHRVFSNLYSTFKNNNIYSIIFNDITEELISSEKMGLSLEKISTNSIYNEKEGFINHFLEKLVESGRHKEEFTKKAVINLVSKNRREGSNSKLKHILSSKLSNKILDIYLKNNPEDKIIWSSIIKSAVDSSTLFSYSNLIKTYMLNSEDKDNIIIDLLTEIKYSEYNPLPSLFSYAGYNFDNQTLDQYSIMDNNEHKYTLLKALSETSIKVIDNKETKEITAFLLSNKKIELDSFLLRNLNEKLANIYSLSTELLPGKTLFDIKINQLNETIKREARGTDVGKIPDKYIRLNNDIYDDCKKGLNRFYKEIDNDVINISKLEEINIFLIPCVLSLTKNQYTLDDIVKLVIDDNEECNSLFKNLSPDINTRTIRVMDNILDDICKSENENEKTDLLYLKKAETYHKLIKIEPNTMIVNKMNILTNLFLINKDNPVLKEDDKLDLAKNIMKNLESLTPQQKEYFLQDSNPEKITKIEHFILNQYMSNSSSNVLTKKSRL